MSNHKTLVPSRILIPEGIDLKKWSVIACDQFTSENEYWKRLETFIGNEKSTLNVIFPECYLNVVNQEEKTESINKKMGEYIEGGFLKEYNGYILTVRSLNSGIKRVGIVGAIDLEDYSYDVEANSLVRATEETVLERIPPRVKIRENAQIELSHIMLLANDSKNGIIENLYENRESYQKVYDFDLNMNGGHITGYFIPESIDLPTEFEKIIKNNIQFLVGDGNHSLATAKEVYEKGKKEGKDVSNLRYCLCEIVNLNSDAIQFEGIHRIVKGVDVGDFLTGCKMMFGGNAMTKVLTKNFDKIISIPENVAECYNMIQIYIDNYLEINGGSVDYIHGIEALEKLAEEDNTVGIIMPSLPKEQLFSLVEEYGSLPRKTFSMGEAEDKRYYLESRKIQ